MNMGPGTMKGGRGCKKLNNVKGKKEFTYPTSSKNNMVDGGFLGSMKKAE